MNIINTVPAYADSMADQTINLYFLQPGFSLIITAIIDSCKMTFPSNNFKDVLIFDNLHEMAVKFTQLCELDYFKRLFFSRFN